MLQKTGFRQSVVLIIPIFAFCVSVHFTFAQPRTEAAGRILKLDREGKVVGILDGPKPSVGRHFDPHQIAVDKDKSIFTAEVMPWRAQKFRLK